MLEMQGGKYGKLLRKRRNWNLWRPFGKNMETQASRVAGGGLFPSTDSIPVIILIFFPIQESCGLEERRWEGILVGVELGCKSSIQCHSDISTNFIAATNQCRPTESGKLFRTKWRCLLWFSGSTTKLHASWWCSWKCRKVAKFCMTL